MEALCRNLSVVSEQATDCYPLSSRTAHSVVPAASSEGKTMGASLPELVGCLQLAETKCILGDLRPVRGSSTGLSCLGVVDSCRVVVCVS